MASRLTGALLVLALGALAWGGGERPSDPAAAPLPEDGSQAVLAVPLADLAGANQAQRESAAAARRALGKRGSFDFQETPLRDALDFLHSLAGVPFHIDAVALQEEGKAVDEPVAFKAADVTVAQALRRILRPHGLTFLLRNEVVTITTEVKAGEILSTRPYNVRRIVEAIDVQVEADKAAGKSPPPRVSFGVPLLADEDGPNFQPLIDVVQQCVPGPWQDIDGNGGSLGTTGRGYTLVVRQTQAVHDEVASLLWALDAFVEGRLNHRAAPLRGELYPAGADARIREALAGRVPALELAENPLKDALEFLSDRASLPILIDTQALSEEGISPDEPVTLRTANLTLQSNLNLLLEPHGLDAVIDDGFLLVTTRVKADEMEHGVLYDVRDLAAVMSIQTLIDLVQNETGGPWQNTQGDGGALASPLHGALVVRATDRLHAETALVLHDLRESLGPDGLKLPDVKTPAPPEDLAKVELRFYPLDRKGLAAEMQKTLVEVIEPESWKANGGEGSIHLIGETLAVKNTLKAHRAIRKFVSDLKAAEDAPPE